MTLAWHYTLNARLFFFTFLLNKFTKLSLKLSLVAKHTIGYFSVVTNFKYHSQEQLTGEEFILVHVSRELSVHICREEMLTEGQTGS